jgi:integrase/recombinase XerD
LHRLGSMTARADQQHVFLNRHDQPLTRDGIAYILRKYVSAVAQREKPMLAHKRITPHVLRHYMAFLTMSCSAAIAWFFGQNRELG